MSAFMGVKTKDRKGRIVGITPDVAAGMIFLGLVTPVRKVVQPTRKKKGKVASKRKSAKRKKKRG